MTVQLTTSDLLARGTALLGPLLEGPHLDAGILLAFALDMPPVRLKSHPEEARTPADLERYLALIERRAQGEPLAYITGKREFWTLELRVTPRRAGAATGDRTAGRARPGAVPGGGRAGGGPGHRLRCDCPGAGGGTAGMGDSGHRCIGRRLGHRHGQRLPAGPDQPDF